MILRGLVTALLLLSMPGCCILTYCGPPAIGAPCDAGGACRGPTDACDTRFSDPGFCTRPCRGLGYFTGCQISGDTGDGYCGISDGDGGLVCTASCDGANLVCPTGFTCLDLDGGALPSGGYGACF